MSDSFLLRGPQEGPPVFSVLGIKFISIASSVEFIGEIIQIVDSIAVVKDPVFVGRDVRSVNKFNLIKLTRANPVATSPIHVPISSIAFLCVPSTQFLNNYLAARSGLVTSPQMSFDETGEDETRM
jgi:hypothetical protein